MDLVHVIKVYLVAHLLTNVDAEDFVSFLTESASDLQCEFPFLTFYPIGYILCQKECVRYSECDVLEYIKDLLECRLYIGTSCVTTSQIPAVNLYKRKTDIKQSIFGTCKLNGCPQSMCVKLERGGHTCVVDGVVAQYNLYDATFIRVNGSYFGLYPTKEKETPAITMCEVFNGRLAVLNTPMKLKVVTDSIQQYEEYTWWVGASKNSDGEVRWSTGELAHPIDEGAGTKTCYTLTIYGKLSDKFCYKKHPFICEANSAE